MPYLSAAVIGYLFGSIPTAYWLCLLVYRLNIFEHGSRNMGATNVYRVLGNRPFAVTLAIDVLKGMAAVLICAAAWPTIPAVVFIAAAAALCGHTLSFWVKFKGGKGVATGLGVFMALAGKSALASLAVFMIVLLASRMVSMSSMLAAVLLPVFIYHFNELGEIYNPYLTGFATIIAMFVIFKHRTNIQRIFRGEEAKLAWRHTSANAGGSAATSPAVEDIK
ncbi:MAG TPA: glycerol-3-phosphate 1-O-acyltransferase PlsY [Candidatus Rifleibacterium sp.]|nr:glycerol-3-phosphate 1-O-acyltransferase PlsY [Candidatus Rifleibacterium sp.]HPT44928.1 glycerol-3-phosphate 1-O-acyltransferase PlsY [Candidatus Rifleibacterium sp.]